MDSKLESQTAAILFWLWIDYGQHSIGFNAGIVKKKQRMKKNENKAEWFRE